MKKRLLTPVVYIGWIIAILRLSQAFAFSTIGKNGMVVTAHPLASTIGLTILKAGGNAIDAAVGAALAIGVLEPHASGLGGGGAMLIYLHEKDSLTYINYYARAPQQFTTDLKSEESTSARTVLVPGTVAGLFHALKYYGTMSENQLLYLVFQELNAGFEVDEYLHQIILDSYETLIKYPQTQAIYLKDGFPIAVNDTIRNERILSTFKKLADQGSNTFYYGEIADSIEAAMIRYDGTLRKSDLSNYHIVETKPLRGNYRGHEIFSAPPPQSGITLIEILNILEFQNLAAWRDYTQNPLTFHFMAEAMKRADADRIEYLGDPQFYQVPVAALISKSFAKTRFQTINMNNTEPSDPQKTPAGDISPFLPNPPSIDEQHGSTTHISAIDATGNAVSLTQTLTSFWGSGISVCGFLLNNGMTGFSSNPANLIAPGKQPRTTIAPTMLFKDGQLFLVIGSPGAGRIISTLVEIVCNIVDFNKSPEVANHMPRFSSRKLERSLAVEARFAPEILKRLESMGHSIRLFGEMDQYFGGVQMILVHPNDRRLVGSSDPRRAGAALGY